MRVLLLGSGRFLVTFLVDELLRRGHEVAALGRDIGGFGGPVVVFEGGEGDGEALREAVDAWRPEVVVDAHHTDAGQAGAVVSACHGVGARSVHLSSLAVFGHRPICPVDEQTALPTPEQAPEAAGLLAADVAVLEAIAQGAPSTLVRLPHLYGPRDPRCGEWFFARRALDGRTRIAVPDAGLAICHRGFVQNMAWGIAQAVTARRAPGQVYHLGEEKLYTVAQLAQGVARALDHQWDLWSVPGHLWTTPYAYTCFTDLRKARSQLRYRDAMIPRDGLELTLGWLCQKPRGSDWSWPGIASAFDYAREDELISRFGAPLES